MSARHIRPSELVRRTFQALGALYGAMAGEDGLTLPQFAVLDVLIRQGPQPAASLTKLTGIDKSTMFMMIHRMSEAGLLAAVAVENQKPGRNPLEISLTPRGRRALQKAETAVWNAEVQLMARLSAQDRGQLLNSLEITAYAALPK